MRSAPSRFLVRQPARASRRGRAPPRRTYRAPRGRPNSAPGILRAIAAAILVSGWLGGAIVLVRASQVQDTYAVEYEIIGDRVYPVTLAESKHERQFVQRMGGDMSVWIAEFDIWLHSLLKPPGLAWTLLVLSTAIGVGCLGLAKLSAEEVDDWDGGDF